MFGRVTRLEHAQIVILQILARLVLDINTQELASLTRLKPDPQFAHTCNHTEYWIHYHPILQAKQFHI